MSDRPSIVVLTPLKNDAWILRRFLEVTSTFADRIIVADQNSTDDGLAICRQFEKVLVIRNPLEEYDEASRQQLLIATARELVPLPRILLALDTDEILTADSLDSPDWERMMRAPPGTTIHFEKPNLHLSPWRCERRPLDFPGAFVDDGTTPHQPRRVHSVRIPAREDGSSLILEGVKFLHYALVRPQAQVAKIRMYAALENLMGTKTLYWRRRYYWAPRVLRALGSVQETPREWFAGWEARGIDMTTIEDRQPYWQDLALLDLMIEHGARRFWFEDIWRKDWRTFQRQHRPNAPIQPPPAALTLALNGAQRLLETLAAARQRLPLRHGQ